MADAANGSAQSRGGGEGEGEGDGEVFDGSKVEEDADDDDDDDDEVVASAGCVDGGAWYETASASLQSSSRSDGNSDCRYL